MNVCSHFKSRFFHPLWKLLYIYASWTVLITVTIWNQILIMFVHNSKWYVRVDKDINLHCHPCEMIYKRKFFPDICGRLRSNSGVRVQKWTSLWEIRAWFQFRSKYIIFNVHISTFCRLFSKASMQSIELNVHPTFVLHSQPLSDSPVAYRRVDCKAKVVLYGTYCSSSSGADGWTTRMHAGRPTYSSTD